MAGYQSAYWERSSGEGFTPPQPTYTGGTAVQRAVEPDGTEWEYDNTSNQWVNLKSGEALAPKDFAIRAGRTGNAASDTKALADEMRREEAQLTAPLVRQPVTSPMPAVRPPSTFYSPSGIARVRAQQPMPSTQIPATQDAWNAALARDPQGAANFFKARQLMDNYEYNQNLQRLISGGMTHEEAVRRIGPPPMAKLGASYYRPQPQPGQVEEVKYGGRPFAKVVQPNGTIVLHPTANPAEKIPEVDRLIKRKNDLQASLNGELAKSAPEDDKIADYRGKIEAVQLAIAQLSPGPTAEPVTPPPTTTIPTAKSGKGYSLPLPDSKSKLIKGEPYDTPKGVLIWNGEKFVSE